MAKTMAEQLSAWAQGKRVEAVDNDSKPRLKYDVASGRDALTLKSRLPTTKMEAMIRAHECRQSIADIDRQLDSDRGGRGEVWQSRAQTAKAAYEHELERMLLAIESFSANETLLKDQLDIERQAKVNAEESCKRLAQEIERLNDAVRGMRVESHGDGTAQAFVEVAQLVLSEVTFTRIMERARDKIGRGSEKNAKESSK